MKTLTCIVAVVLVVAIVYFATVSNKQFYRLLDTVADVFGTIGSNYLKKMKVHHRQFYSIKCRKFFIIAQ